MVIQVASIPTRYYKEIIEVRVVTRFYWTPDGRFDGIEFGPFEATLQEWEMAMLTKCLNAVGHCIGLDSLPENLSPP